MLIENFRCFHFLKFKDKKIILFSMPILVSFFVYNIFRSMSLAILGIIIWIVLCVVMSPTDYFMLSILLAPSISWLKIVGRTNSIFGYIFLLFALKYVLLKKRVVIYRAFLVHFFIVMITVSFHNELFSQLIRCIVYLIISSQILKDNNDEQFKVSCISLFCIGEFFNVAIGVLFSIQKGNLNSGFFGGIRDDRNYYSAIISVAIILSIYLILKHGKRYMYTFLPLLAFGGLLSQSRTFILSLVFSVLLVLGLFFQKKVNYRVVLFLMAIFVAVFIAYPYISGLFQSLLERFTKDDILTGNHRFELWSYYIKIVCSSPKRFLFGSGNSENYLTASWRLVEHNTYIQTFFSIGVLGLVSLLGCYIKLFKTISPSDGKLNMLSFLPLITGLFLYSAINAMYSDILNIIIIVCFMVIDIEKTNPETRMIRIINCLTNKHQKTLKGKSL